MGITATLRQAGIDEVRAVAIERDDIDALVDVVVDGHPTRLAIEYKMRAPYPNEVHRFNSHRERLAPIGRPVFAAPYVTESVGEALREAGWSWVDEVGNLDVRADGVILRRRTAEPPAPSRTGRLPRGEGSSWIIRELIQERGREAGIVLTRLAENARVTQPRVSQVLRKLSDLGLAVKDPDGRWRVPDRSALLDRFLDDYPGPGGSERFYYSLDSPRDVAARACALSSDRHPVVVSADVGPDQLKSWRVPDKLVIYARTDIEAGDLGAVAVDERHAANVMVRSPRDGSVFRQNRPTRPDGSGDGSELLLADPVQMVWDLIDLGGADRAEAAEELKRWIIDRP